MGNNSSKCQVWVSCCCKVISNVVSVEVKMLKNDYSFVWKAIELVKFCFSI